ncbi:hypothetical protein FJ251_10700 [bacterium]|nr:hypothetical protein [bacterium]
MTPPIRGSALTLALMLLLTSPGGVLGETLHRVTLLDGSVLQGRLIAMDDAQLILHTDFADSLRIARDRIKEIAFVTGEAALPTPAVAAGPAGVGQLEVALIGDQPRSSARYRRPGDRERMLDLNVLHFKVFIDGALAYQDADSTIEKEFSDRGWTFLRNDHEFPPVILAVPAGSHRVLIVVGNELDRLEAGEKQSQLCSAELMVEDVLVRPDEKTRLAIAGDGSRFRYGKYALKLLSTR